MYFFSITLPVMFLLYVYTVSCMPLGSHPGSIHLIDFGSQPKSEKQLFQERWNGNFADRLNLPGEIKPQQKGKDVGNIFSTPNDYSPESLYAPKHPAPYPHPMARQGDWPSGSTSQSSTPPVEWRDWVAQNLGDHDSSLIAPAAKGGIRKPSQLSNAPITPGAPEASSACGEDKSKAKELIDASAAAWDAFVGWCKGAWEKTKGVLKPEEAWQKTKEVLNPGELWQKTKDALNPGEVWQKTKDAFNSEEVWQKTKEALNPGEVWQKTKDVLNPGEAWKQVKNVFRPGYCHRPGCTPYPPPPTFRLPHNGIFDHK